MAHAIEQAPNGKWYTRSGCEWFDATKIQGVTHDGVIVHDGCPDEEIDGPFETEDEARRFAEAEEAE